MIKIFTKSAVFSSLLIGLVALSNQVAFAASRCVVNGQQVDCAELAHKAKSFFAWGAGISILITAFLIWALVFWIMMIIHVASHSVNNKGVWIVVVVFTGIIGALIYYFTVKRKFSQQSAPSDLTAPRV